MADTTRNIGAQMANVMFNLSQRPGDALTGDVVAKMDSLRKQWDAAVRATPPSPSTAPEVGERAIAELALTRARMLGTAGMEFAAHLCLMGVRTINDIDYVPRDGVMNEVAAWRRAFDNAPEVNDPARRALASRPAEASLQTMHEIENAESLQRDRPAEVDDEGLPPLPEQYPELRARWECDSCGGRGHDGEAHWQGHFQPPEPFPCGDCDGAGQVPIEAYTAEQYRQGQRDAVAADRARRGGGDAA